jgi:hypothetical protein
MDLPDAEAHEDSKRPARVVDSSGQMWIDIPESNPIRGGNPLLWTEGEKAAIVVGTRAGRGCVIACSAAYLFSSEIMGHTNATPTERQRNIYELEFAMLRAARERDVDRPLLLTPVEASAAQSATP